MFLFFISHLLFVHWIVITVTSTHKHEAIINVMEQNVFVFSPYNESKWDPLLFDFQSTDENSFWNKMWVTE